jgi:hypothetical protein
MQLTETNPKISATSKLQNAQAAILIAPPPPSPTLPMLLSWGGVTVD